MKLFAQILFAVSTLILFYSCNRAGQESTVRIKLPDYSAMGTLDCTGVPCLKAIFVNVDGRDFSTIYSETTDSSFSSSSTQIASEVALVVPAGTEREIKVLAVYRETTGEMKPYFIGKRLDVDAASINDVSMNVTTEGKPMNISKIAGRWLTSADYGPTGAIVMTITEPVSGMSMKVFKGYILNGWFNLMGSKNFGVKYELVDQGHLFSGTSVKLSDLATYSTSSTRVYVARPNVLYRRPLETQEFQDGSDILFGFFSATPSLLAGKVACKEGHATNQLYYNLLAVSGAGVVSATYSTLASTSPTIIAESGKTFSADSECITGAEQVSSTDAVRYDKDRISVNMSQFDGAGNDTAIGMESILSYGSYAEYTASSTEITRFESAGNYYRFKTLPGIISTTGPLTGVSLFTGTTASKPENVLCNYIDLAIAGFTPATFLDFEAGLSPNLVGENTISFKFANTPVSGTSIAVCPVASSGLYPLPATYLTTVNEFSVQGLIETAVSSTGDATVSAISTGTVDFGFVPNLATVTKSIFFKNVGNAAGAVTIAADLSGSGLFSPVQVGSTALGTGQTMHYSTSITSNGSGPASGTIKVSYQVGAKTRTLIVKLKAFLLP